MQYFTDKPIEWLHYSSIKGLNAKEQTEWFKKTFRHMFKTIQDDSAHWILDRSHLGEEVYGSTYRPTESHEYIWNLEKEFDISEREDMFLIIMYDSSFKNLERDDGDSYSTELEMCKKEVEGFKRAYEKTSIKNKLLLDISGKDINQVAEEIKEFLKV